MSLRITKASEGRYVVSAAPPDVRVGWTTEEPLPTDELIEELLSRGAHQTDIGDAFYTADHDWLKK